MTSHLTESRPRRSRRRTYFIQLISKEFFRSCHIETNQQQGNYGLFKRNIKTKNTLLICDQDTCRTPELNFLDCSWTRA